MLRPYAQRNMLRPYAAITISADCRGTALLCPGNAVIAERLAIYA